MVMKSPNERLQANAGANQQIGGYGGASMPSAAPFHSMVGQFEIAEKLKGASMNYLKNYVRNPSGNIPLYMVMAEIQRRVDGQRRAKIADAAAKERRPTVAQQVLDQAGMTQEEGIMSPVAAFEQAQANRQINARSGGLMQFSNGGEVDNRDALTVSDVGVRTLKDRKRNIIPNEVVERIQSKQVAIVGKDRVMGADEIRENIRKAGAAADRAGLKGEDKATYLALLERESAFHPEAKSPTGALGIGQITTDTARKPGFGVASIKPNDRLNVDKSLKFSAEYFKGLVDKHKNNTVAAAAYNIGTGTIDAAGTDGTDPLQALKDGFGSKEIQTQFEKQTEPLVAEVTANRGSYVTELPSGFSAKGVMRNIADFFSPEAAASTDAEPPTTKEVGKMQQDFEREITKSPPATTGGIAWNVPPVSTTGPDAFAMAAQEQQNRALTESMAGNMLPPFVGPPEPPDNQGFFGNLFYDKIPGILGHKRPNPNQTEDRDALILSDENVRNVEGGLGRYVTPSFIRLPTGEKDRLGRPIFKSSKNTVYEDFSPGAFLNGAVVDPENLGNEKSEKPGKMVGSDLGEDITSVAGAQTEARNNQTDPRSGDPVSKKYNKLYDSDQTSPGSLLGSGNFFNDLDKILNQNTSKKGDQFYVNAAAIEKREGKNNPFTELREMFKAQNVSRKEQNKFLNSLPFFSAALKAIKSNDPSVLGTLASAGEGFLTSALQVKDKIAQADNAALQTQMLLSQAELAQQNKDLDREQALMLAARQSDFANKQLSAQTFIDIHKIAATLQASKMATRGKAMTEAFKAEQARRLEVLKSNLDTVDQKVAALLKQKGIEPGDEGYVENFESLRRKMLSNVGV